MRQSRQLVRDPEACDFECRDAGVRTQELLAHCVYRKELDVLSVLSVEYVLFRRQYCAA
jgi:hypothetical protein